MAWKHILIRGVRTRASKRNDRKRHRLVIYAQALAGEDCTWSVFHGPPITDLAEGATRVVPGRWRNYGRTRHIPWRKHSSARSGYASAIAQSTLVRTVSHARSFPTRHLSSRSSQS